MSEGCPQGRIISIDEGQVKSQLNAVVRETVEQTLNSLLDAEADSLCGTRRYERSDKRVDTRAGHYERSLHTTAGPVTLKVPKLRTLLFESAIIDRYRRRECSVEEALMEMYLAGISVRRVEDITEALWGTRVSAGVVSKLNQELYDKIGAWRNQRIEGEYAYVYLDGIVLKRTWADEVCNVSILVAFGVNADGYREILGAAEGAKEDKAGWGSFIASLKERGLTGVKLFISDKCMGLVESLGDYYPEAQWQRCAVHFYRNVFTNVPCTKVKDVAERIMREIRRRTRVVGNFPDGRSALMLVAARLRYISGREWETRRYLEMTKLAGMVSYLVLDA